MQHANGVMLLFLGSQYGVLPKHHIMGNPWSPSTSLHLELCPLDTGMLGSGVPGWLPRQQPPVNVAWAVLLVIVPLALTEPKPAIFVFAAEAATVRLAAAAVTAPPTAAAAPVALTAAAAAVMFAGGPTWSYLWCSLNPCNSCVNTFRLINVRSTRRNEN
jgi:hypothetical protein